jgi:SP family sugar:H+ symporter-like MFS transporter
MLIVGILGFVPKTSALKNFLIFVACVWSFFNVARKFPESGAIGVSNSLLTSRVVGSLGWAFVGEIASQKLRARTAGIAAGISVLFGLTFNTSLPVMRK